mgnify:CR=1 FL=1
MVGSGADDGDGQREVALEKSEGSHSSLEENKSPFEMPEDDGDTFRDIGVALGSLDDPSRVVPTVQYGIESRLPYFTDLAGLPGKTTEEDIEKLLAKNPNPIPEPAH